MPRHRYVWTYREYDYFIWYTKPTPSAVNGGEVDRGKTGGDFRVRGGKYKVTSVGSIWNSICSCTHNHRNNCSCPIELEPISQFIIWLNYAIVKLASRFIKRSASVSTPCRVVCGGLVLVRVAIKNDHTSHRINGAWFGREESDPSGNVKWMGIVKFMPRLLYYVSPV